MRIGNWEIVKSLGTGRWSQVALAKPSGCQSNNADYVIKFINPASEDFAYSQFMLVREFACSRLMSHGSIISFLDGNPHHSTPFLVSARQSGETLKQLKNEIGQLVELRDKLTCFRQICDAVSEFHQLGIRHGDLSPSNILFDLHSRQTLIIDLGLSEKINPFKREIESVAGTWGYVAPECLQSHMPINLSADIFSLGKTLIEFVGTSNRAKSIGRFDYGPIHERLTQLLESMCEDNPLKRPTIDEIIQQVSLLEIGCLEIDYRSAA